MRLREKLLQAELAAAKLGIHEVGANNHGPWVKKFLAEVGLPEGYAWCDAFQSYEIHAAAGRRLSIESASVAATYAEARRLGWLVSTPAREDLVLYDFDGDGQTDDHIGIVESVGSVPGGWKLVTVEGNTSSGTSGSQADGGGVYVRTRLVKKSSVAFIRIPGVVAGPAPAKKPKAKAKPKAKVALPLTLKKNARGNAVKILQRQLKKAGAKVVVDGVFGPSTLNSVRAFQRRHGLKADGVVGAKTWAKLQKVTG